MPQSADSEIIAGARILVVEDEFLIALELERILKEAGAREVVLASQAVEALAALSKDEPLDMAVLDVRLGAESGEPVARALRERGIAFVIATGAANGSAAWEGFGDVPVVEKPFDADTLVQRLAAAVRAARG
jgi:DNA-binding response OmpR family regulator